MVLLKYDGILLITVSPKTIENANGCNNYKNYNYNYNISIIILYNIIYYIICI